MASSSQKVLANYSPHVRKSLLFFRGICFAMEDGLNPLLVESDAAMVVKWINDVCHKSSDVGIILTDILDFLKAQWCVSIQYVLRDGNRVAHLLAKNVFRCVKDMYWTEDYPSCVRTSDLAD
ncbi:hypothetical protein Ddye_017026 [Dipteronia dyeriana]|uniref:RNase H type-1 domain-containing protein n=1 Tax=Dipteronia dyeriana TaxID=168575 RepID=A0AAD9U7X9_9ROSI|nr:hypothetical protein Ddye_017026 [Dipteronia dyeriana]